MKFSKDITAATNVSYKHVWRYVRRAGIEPQKANGTLFITDEQFSAFVGMVKSGELETRVVKPKPVSRAPRVNKQKTATKNGITLQTEDQVAKAKARQAIMQRRLLLGIVYEGMHPYPIEAVGTPEQVAALKEKWA